MSSDQAIEAGNPSMFGPSWDHLSPAFHEDYYAKMADAQQRCPIPHSDLFGGMWMVTTYEDVKNVLQDWQTFSNTGSSTWPRDMSLARMVPIDLDPPEQQLYRRALHPYFSVQAAEVHREGATKLANSMIDEFIEDGRCDMAAQFTRSFPAYFFIEQVLGSSRAEVPTLVEWCGAIAVDQSNERGQAAFAGMAEWITAHLATTNAEGLPVIEGLRDIQIDGHPLSPEDRVSILHSLIVGGLDTTANLLGNAVHHFAEQPELADQLREDPSLIPAAVEELIRFEAPVLGLFKTVSHDTVLSGCPMHAGDKVLVSYAAANRDPKAFDDPNELRFDRGGSRHLGFGLGVHRCIGINLARLEASVALAAIVERMRHIELDGEMQEQAHYARGPVSLPIKFDPGPRLG